jgi:hypothetical protein
MKDREALFNEFVAAARKKEKEDSKTRGEKVRRLSCRREGSTCMCVPWMCTVVIHIYNHFIITSFHNAYFMNVSKLYTVALNSDK